MILRPVTPESPWGPPITNRPVAFTQRFMSGARSSGGTTLSMTSEFTASRRCSVETLSSCCAAMTTACTLYGRPLRYSTETWLFPSGRRNDNPDRRHSARRRVSRWAKAMGSGINSGVSSQA